MRNRREDPFSTPGPPNQDPGFLWKTLCCETIGYEKKVEAAAQAVINENG